MSQVAPQGTTGNKRVYYNCILNSAWACDKLFFWYSNTVQYLVARGSSRFFHFSSIFVIYYI